MRNLLALICFVVVVAVAASTGATFMPGTWYLGLAKPAWTPPGWLFAPVWTVLYMMIAVAGWLVWRSRQAVATGPSGKAPVVSPREERSGRATALAAWVAQLVLNASWSWLMFGRHQIGFAMIDLAGMWIAIVAFIALAWRLSPTAALLFVPYLAWVSFAGALNFAILRLNP